jgi:5'-deoxynucleotidase YfbR-like HD superfamily hydrolase
MEFGLLHDNHEVMFTRQELALMGLLHDGSESFNGDLIRPLKYSVEFSEPFEKVERLNEVAVADRFGIPVHLPRIIKMADEAVCAAESRQIVPKDPSEEWQSGICHDEEIIAPFEIEMLLPFEAKKLFLTHFERLTMKRVAAA